MMKLQIFVCVVVACSFVTGDPVPADALPVVAVEPKASQQSNSASSGVSSEHNDDNSSSSDDHSSSDDDDDGDNDEEGASDDTSSNASLETKVDPLVVQ